MAKDSRDQERQPKKCNCWEVVGCGREPGGKKAKESGACPAAFDLSFDGINSGECGGRVCWAITGTYCGEDVQGSFEDKRALCTQCDFYQMVREEEVVAGRKTKFLQFINNETRSPFFDKMQLRHVKAGTRFVTQGAVEDSAFVIDRGSCLVIVEKDGVLHPVDHYGEGDIVGGLGILTGEPRRAHVEAETDMELWEMTREQFEEMTSQSPDLMDFITELVADRLDSRRPTAYRTIGKYIATEIIGRGAFSIVYKGEHKGLSMPIVIKMMRHDMALNSEFIENFRFEAKTIANLNHKHIVKVYDFDERYRTLFIIMENVPGESLKEMIQRLRRLPPKLASEFLVQICSALQYAHERGVIHRDINPSNIIAQPSDQVKVLDFGLACPVGTEDFSNTGTASYMAPEQIEGDPVDARTDIYALGITAYEIVTGERPFPEDDLSALLDIHVNEEIPDPAEKVEDLPDEIRTFILKACRRDPKERFQNAAEAMEHLQRLINRPELSDNHLKFEKRMMSTMFLIYSDQNQLPLNRLMDEFSEKAMALGVDVKLADFRDLQ